MKLQFDVAGADITSVRAFSYKYYLDGHTVGSPLVGVTVEEHDGYFTCTAPIPPEALALKSEPNETPLVKNHTLELTVTDNAGESAKSEKLTVEAESVLPAPSNLRLHGVLKSPPSNLKTVSSFKN